ncbi:MAG: hypothetical protein IK104_05650 [Clostridia bacterium]|nr:hypothetical protein [Clostridia bacterium]
MKKTLALLLAALILALCSCSMISDIKANVEKNANRKILDTPEADAVPELFRSAVTTSFTDAVKVEESSSISIGKPEVEGEGDIALLKAAAGLLKDLIAEGAPGSESREVTAAAGTMLEKFDPAKALAILPGRNTSSEPVTDEKGYEVIVAVTEIVTDENGNETAVPVTRMVEDENGSEIAEAQSETLTETHNTDNLLKVTFRYYNTEKGEKKEDGSEGDTVYLPADEALLEEVFGAKRDKEEVLGHFTVVENYLADIDYTFTYRDPEVRAELDMDRTRLNSASFNKVVCVTATARGVGKLEGVGEITITFDLTETTAYAFHYPVVE